MSIDQPAPDFSGCNPVEQLPTLTIKGLPEDEYKNAIYFERDIHEGFAIVFLADFDYEKHPDLEIEITRNFKLENDEVMHSNPYTIEVKATREDSPSGKCTSFAEED